MSFELPITIADALVKIQSNSFLLPAIQREYVWSASQVELLFDSLLKGYPISSFLFWRVENEVAKKYKFYKFLSEYRERFKIHNEEIPIDGRGTFNAVLDGQQRLTSLYIGLLGSYAYKEYYRVWANTEWSIPTRHLYLNVTSTLKDQEDGRVYDFKFLKDEDTEKKDLVEIDGCRTLRVGKILDLKNLAAFNRFVGSNTFTDSEIDLIAKLQEVVHSDRLINYYEEKEQNLDKALNIFIRINGGGERLNFSDLIMSIAVANWENKDARKEIHSLVDAVRNEGYLIDKDFVLKVFLFLHSKDIKFKVTNFSIQNARQFEKEWEPIRNVILEVFSLLKSFGFTELTLTSKNVLIPIIYYIYHRKITINFTTKKMFESDRKLIAKWIHVSLVKRVFGGQSDSVLTQIRKAFTSDVTKTGINSTISRFPSEEIFKSISKDVSVGDDFIEDLLSIQKDDKYAFSILALLFPSLDYRNNNFHKDHLHPTAKFKNLLKKDQQDLGWSAYNSIINLQMLDANENTSKGDIDLKIWVDDQLKTRSKRNFYRDHLIPDVDLDIKNFAQFYFDRKAILLSTLKRELQ